MDRFEANEVAIHLKMFKRLGFYQMFDPSATGRYSANVYRTCLVTVVAMVQCFFGYGMLGFFVETDDTARAVDRFMLVNINVVWYLCCWKLIVCFWHARQIWELFDATRVRFLASARCRRHAARVLRGHRRDSVAATNVCFALCFALAVQWVCTPIVLNSTAATDAGQRFQNVMNLHYPVAVATYNRHYVLFYVFESTAGIVLLYVMLMTDALLMSLAWVITAQYEVLINALQTFNNSSHEIQQQTTDTDFTNDYVEMKSILFDQQQLYLKTKLYYSIIRPIILVYVAIHFIIIITMSFVLISICLSAESSVFDIIKIGFGLLYIFFNLFLPCYLFDNLNHKKESVNFGIYSCNWTAMDLKIKKLILLAMCMNNASRLKLQISPEKIINLHIFAKVIMTSYNIVSVMLKITNNEKELSENN